MTDALSTVRSQLHKKSGCILHKRQNTFWCPCPGLAIIKPIYQILLIITLLHIQRTDPASLSNMTALSSYENEAYITARKAETKRNWKMLTGTPTKEATGQCQWKRQVVEGGALCSL